MNIEKYYFVYYIMKETAQHHSAIIDQHPLEWANPKSLWGSHYILCNWQEITKEEVIKYGEDFRWHRSK